MQSFKLENIKSFKNTPEIELKPINIFVGPNSSGKSSLIRFPVVLNQTVIDENTPLKLFGNLIDYGNFEDVIYNHKGHTISFEIIFDKIRFPVHYEDPKNDFEKNINSVRKLLSTGDLKIKVKLYKDKKIYVDEFALKADNKEILKIKKAGKGLNATYDMKFYFNGVNKYLKKIQMDFVGFIPDIRYGTNETIMDDLCSNIVNKEVDLRKMLYLRQDFPLELESESLNSKGFSKNDIRKIKSNVTKLNLLSNIQRLLNELQYKTRPHLTNIIYIGPFRKSPERIYRDSETNFLNVGVEGENTVLLLKQSEQNEKKGYKTVEKVSEWLYDSLGYSLKLEEIESTQLFKVLISSPNNSTGDNIIDVGYGISQVLPIVTQLYHKRHGNGRWKYHKNSIFIIEQPELHLHPAAQSQLADLFVEKVVSDKRSKLLIETHSEHLIRKLQILVADPECMINSEDIAIYYISKKGKSTESEILRINMNDNGTFADEWPSGFFDKNYELSKQLLLLNLKNNKSKGDEQ
ncbi:putative ATPase [Methanococcus maripaludis]|uniref:Putative ATPase n=1 Tax=Methanococcus maripaludis TaxID=39152 RepID=A0A7J9P3C6_METMI|nr:DUF3696 domain-containing protein [Methanococcus maripaludis]MBA2853934.1 putative ATPase [Methanococcus maripaludis]